MKHCALFLVLAITSLSGTLRAQVPRLVNYQGRVAVNTVNFDGTGQFKFALVNSNGSVTYWSNDGTSNGGSQPASAVTLTVAKGLYSVLLGDTVLGNMIAIPASVFANPDVRLRVWFNDGVNGSQLLTPDQRLAPATYLADGTVTPATIGAAAITSGKIAAGAVNNTSIAPGSLDSTIFAVPGAPNAGQVLGFNGTGLTWTAPGGGVFSLNGTNAYYNGGNVGLGTSSPQTGYRLDVIGSTRLAPGGSGGVVQVGVPGGETGLAIVGTNRADIRFDGLTLKLLAATGVGTPSSANGVVINTAGAVGIGTVLPQAKLHVYEPGSAVQVIETGGGTNASAQLRYRNTGGDWATGTSRGFNNDEFYIDRLGNSSLEFQLATNGNLGLGIEPQAKLHVYAAGSVSHRIDSGGSTNAWSRIELKNANGQWNIGTSLNFVGDQLYFARDGSAQVFSIQPNGDTFAAGTMSCKVLTIRGGADLAEPFPMKEEELERGSVVVIDSEHPGRLRRSTTPYDRRVAGIISGANGVSPGIALHQEGVMEGGQNVALSGRVYVAADASASPIEPGDLLTTSDTPGHAMKVTDHERAHGAVIGKAMSALDEGKGMVLVLVTLQ